MRCATEAKRLPRELFGVFLLFLGIIVSLSLITFNSSDPHLNHVVKISGGVNNGAGIFGAYLSGFLVDFLGLSSYFIPFFFLFAGYKNIFGQNNIKASQKISIFIFWLCIATASYSFNLSIGDIKGGGLVGISLGRFMINFFSPIGSSLIFSFLLLFAAQLYFNFSWLSFLTQFFINTGLKINNIYNKISEILSKAALRKSRHSQGSAELSKKKQATQPLLAKQSASFHVPKDSKYTKKTNSNFNANNYGYDNDEELDDNTPTRKKGWVSASELAEEFADSLEPTKSEEKNTHAETEVQIEQAEPEDQVLELKNLSQTQEPEKIDVSTPFIRSIIERKVQTQPIEASKAELNNPLVAAPVAPPIAAPIALAKQELKTEDFPKNDLFAGNDLFSEPENFPPTPSSESKLSSINFNEQNNNFEDNSDLDWLNGPSPLQKRIQELEQKQATKDLTLNDTALMQNSDSQPINNSHNNNEFETQATEYSHSALCQEHLSALVYASRLEQEKGNNAIALETLTPQNTIQATPQNLDLMATLSQKMHSSSQENINIEASAQQSENITLPKPSAEASPKTNLELEPPFEPSLDSFLNPSLNTSLNSSLAANNSSVELPKQSAHAWQQQNEPTAQNNKLEDPKDTNDYATDYTTDYPNDDEIEIDINANEPSQILNELENLGASNQIAKAAPIVFQLPELDLLEATSDNSSGPADEILDEKARSLMLCLSNFGVQGELTKIVPGPVVTMFEVRPAPGVRVAKIASLNDDLALALKAVAVRIQAPIPGSDTVGIEIPNEQRETVSFKDILDSKNYNDSESLLTMALGKDIAGNPVSADLAKMPHLLVAGATGAGKSVCLNSILLSFLYKAKPDELKLLLIDPKRIEMAIYADLPHLVHPVVTEMSLAKKALDWAVAEMDRRYIQIARLGVRNILAFNAKLTEMGENKPAELADLEIMPYMVIIIDELADLMLTGPKEIETSIVRLAQLARAAGIHLILATQRPSVDVVTGLIKANFPCRISFQVTSKHDSRTILDAVGAEHLLGKGDMLFKPSGGKFVRLHGAFVSDDEVGRVVDFWREQMPPSYKIDLSNWGGSESGSNGSGDLIDNINSDPIYNEAVDFVTQQGKASISLIQRRFRIGFNRAARYIEQMEYDGIIGPADGSKPRLVNR